MSDVTSTSDGETVNYVIEDVTDHLARHERNSVELVVLDDAWARPLRGDAFGVTYPTHEFETTKTILSEIKRVLTDGGFMLADADDWLVAKLTPYLRREWGDVSANDDSGYHAVGSVTLLTQDGEPDRSTPGMYGSTGGYSTVFASNGGVSKLSEDHIQAQTNIFQTAQRQREQYGWGTVKPVDPYREWISDLCDNGDTILTPCAGTAPAAIAASQLNIDLTCIACDIEKEAREAYHRRKEDETWQQSFSAF